MAWNVLLQMKVYYLQKGANPYLTLTTTLNLIQVVLEEDTQFVQVLVQRMSTGSKPTEHTP